MTAEQTNNTISDNKHNPRCMFEGCNNIGAVRVKATIGIEKDPVDLYLCIEHQKTLLNSFSIQQSIEFKMTDLKDMKTEFEEVR